MNEAINWSGVPLVFGALALAAAIVSFSMSPVIGQPLPFDQSLKAENDPKALEKKMHELGREGWELKNVTSVVSGGGRRERRDDMRIFLFWERAAVSN